MSLHTFSRKYLSCVIIKSVVLLEAKRFQPRDHIQVQMVRRLIQEIVGPGFRAAPVLMQPFSFLHHLKSLPTDLNRKGLTFLGSLAPLLLVSSSICSVHFIRCVLNSVHLTCICFAYHSSDILSNASNSRSSPPYIRCRVG